MRGVLLTLLTAAALTFPDPAGDARGDGGYILPARPELNERMLDLRAFTAQPVGQGMRFTVALEQIGNPWQAPSGYSAGVTDIYVKTAAGGQRALSGTGLSARSGGGWQYHLRVTGFGATLEEVVDSSANQVRRLSAPTVRLEGSSLIVDAAVPAGKYAYWVTNSIYTPLSADGVLRPSTAQSPLALRVGREGAPTPVDVLAAPGDLLAFTAGTLAPVGQTRGTHTLTLAGLGLLGLALTVGATLFARRQGSLGGR